MTPGTDAAAIQSGRVSVTPLQRDLTAYGAASEVVELLDAEPPQPAGR